MTTEAAKNQFSAASSGATIYVLSVQSHWLSCFPSAPSMLLGRQAQPTAPPSSQRSNPHPRMNLTRGSHAGCPGFTSHFWSTDPSAEGPHTILRWETRLRDGHRRQEEEKLDLGRTGQRSEPLGGAASAPLLSATPRCPSTGCPGPWAQGSALSPAQLSQPQVPGSLMHGQCLSHTPAHVQQGALTTWPCPRGHRNHGCNTPVEPLSHTAICVT